MATFPSIRIEGGLLGPDLLDKLVAGELPGQKAADFGIDGKRSITDEIAAAFADARALWGVFQNRLQRLPEDDLATTVTRDAWMIPFLGLLGYEPTYNSRAHEVDGLTFAISHRAGEPEDAPPVHVVGARQELGRVPLSGRPRLAPHSLVQEYLNRTEHLWGIVTNGRTLRLLRDCTLVRRQAYVEFDLSAMLEERRFQDFAALYRLLHCTRLPRTDENAADCLLEQYYAHSIEQGGRVRDRLRDGVEQCILGLANGFLHHPASDDLRRRVAPDCADNNRITPKDFYRQLLRLVYRLLFLLVSEDRGLLSPDPLYREHYGIVRLRRLLDNRAAFTEHDDLWHSLRVLWYLLNNDTPQPALGGRTMAATLGLPVLNGDLFAPIDLDACTITNQDLLGAFWHLAYYTERLERGRTGATRRVNYAALDVEELGSVYESLLDFHPAIESPDRPGGPPRFALVFGSERKTTGSYYTPPELVAELIRSALEPVIRERLDAVRKANPRAGANDLEKALLSIRVCDPACGSGHFLLAAARRLGKELARVRTREDEPAPERVREAVRDVVSHCIYGVDRNPLAVDLCRVALWLESHAEGKPLTFLDHRIRCGDSLIGVFDLAVLKAGIPDKAFEPREGDDKALALEAARLNRGEREGSPLYTLDFAQALSECARQAREVDAIADESPEAIRCKRELYESGHKNAAWRRLRELCDLWCAAFFQPLRDDGPPITTGALFDRAQGRSVDGRIPALAAQFAATQRFFHWPLEFPEVFTAGGFDCLLSNPPWERVKLQEQEFFAARDPRIAAAPNKAARARLIAALRDDNPALHREFMDALRGASGSSQFLRHSGRYPLCGRGDINTYAVFAELNRALTGPRGRMGVIVPTGIATDDTTKFFFGDLVETRTLVSYFGFKNERFLFPRPVEHTVTFGLLTVVGRALSSEQMQFCWLAWTVEEMNDPARRIVLTADDITLLNPNTRTCPVFRFERDAEITKAIYRRVPVLIREARDGVSESNPWGLTFLRMFDMANDSGLFIDPEVACPAVREALLQKPDEPPPFLPLYEAKMLHQFDHRWATYARDGCDWLSTPILTKVNKDGKEEPDTRELSPAEKDRPEVFAAPRYWVSAAEVEARLIKTDKDGNVTWRWEREWLLGWRDISNATNERTLIAGVMPIVATGDTVLLMFPNVENASQPGCLIACLDAFVVDYAARQKVGGTHLKYHTFKQFPILPPSAFAAPCPWDDSGGQTLADWIAPRVLELVYTAHDLAGFARDLGYDGPPFRWDVARRAQIRAELDAAFFHLYGVSRDDAAYIMDTFLVFKAHDEERHGGVYRTRETILAIYDQMDEARRSGRAWRSPLDPPPGDPRAAHPAGRVASP